LESEIRPPTGSTTDVQKTHPPGADSESAQPGHKHGPTRFHGSVTLDPTRVGRDAGRIADEIVSHLTGLMGSTVKVTLEIDAEIQSGTPDQLVRTVTENCRTLKFTSQGFETECRDAQRRCRSSWASLGRRARRQRREGLGPARAAVGATSGSVVHHSKNLPPTAEMGQKSVIAVMSAARSLFHQEQTFVGTLRTAVSCQKRTHAPQ
jgi:hypothetical protein